MSFNDIIQPMSGGEKLLVTIVESEDSIARPLSLALEFEGYSTRRLSHQDIFHPSSDTFSESGEIVLFDIPYAGRKVFEEYFKRFMEISQQLSPQVVLIAMTTSPSFLNNLAGETWRQNEDFISKPYNLDDLLSMIERRHPARRGD